jgi:hypothetical protein
MGTTVPRQPVGEDASPRLDVGVIMDRMIGSIKNSETTNPSFNLVDRLLEKMLPRRRWPRRSKRADAFFGTLITAFRTTSERNAPDLA